MNDMVVSQVSFRPESPDGLILYNGQGGGTYILLYIRITCTHPPTEYTECWPCPLFDILLSIFLLASLVTGRRPQCVAGAP
jgi:hypothetical protein